MLCLSHNLFGATDTESLFGNIENKLFDGVLCMDVNESMYYCPAEVYSDYFQGLQLAYKLAALGLARVNPEYLGLD